MFPIGSGSGLERSSRILGDRLANLVPHFVASHSGFGGEGNNGGSGIYLRQAPYCIAQVVVRQPITFGSDQDKIAACTVKKI